MEDMAQKERRADNAEIYALTARSNAWQAQEVGLGVARCPESWGDHQWPVHRQQVTIRIGMTAHV
jgi:hypothetical protein